MIINAAEATWGVPGPTFLLIYLGAVALVAVLALTHRRVGFAGPAEPPIGSLSAEQVAYLNGGAPLAVYTSLGALRAAGAVDIAAGRALVQTGAMPAGATRLDAAIYNVAGRRVRVRNVPEQQWVVDALAQVRDGLTATGLVPTPAQRRSLRLWAVAGVVLIALGAARLAAGLGNQRPVGWLIASFLLLVVLLTAFLLAPAPRRTRAGTRALQQLRTRHDHLAPANRPSYATYGAAGAAMGVALYGAATLYLVDPAFAAQAEVQRQAAGAAGSTGTSCGGSSASYGGGDSGGSSDGGGGGCGGGCGG